LRRVASLTEELAQARITQLSSEFTDDREWERKHWEERAKGVRIETVDGADSVTGPPDEIFEQLDRRTIGKIRIFAELGTVDEQLEVTSPGPPVSSLARQSRYASDQRIPAGLSSA
jgi:hypothetical protein